MVIFVVCLLALAVGAYAFVLHRISAFRVDRPWERSYFGSVIESWSGLGHLRRENYRPEGQRYYPWLIRTWVVVSIVTICTAAYLVIHFS